MACLSAQLNRLRINTIRIHANIRNESTQIQAKITRPNRIKREPTTILRALAGTIKTDPTAAHYKYHDDPFLIPKSNLGKRAFAMAQEAGRKSAHWVREQHPELFQHTIAEPPIKSYLPQKFYDENSDVDEDVLMGLINDVRVSETIKVYGLLESKKIPVTNDTKQKLLEFLCFTNAEDQFPAEFIEEKWFTQTMTNQARRKKTWTDHQLIGKLFAELPETSETYSALIQGMLKYYEVEKAWFHYDNARKRGIDMSLETYNYLLRSVTFLRDANEKRWELTLELLTSMRNQQLTPNVQTLNAILETLTAFSGSRNLKTYIQATLKEFETIVEPSLASWYWILMASYPKKGSNSGVLIDILDHIDGKRFEIRDLNDTMFFVTAMDVCRNFLSDLNVANRVDALLNVGDNYNLIGDSYKESVYYRNYFLLKCTLDTLASFMDFYNYLVPNVYVPEPGVMFEVLKQIEINDALDLVPRIYSDMTMFDQTDRENLVALVLRIMANGRERDDEQLRQQIVNVAWMIFEKIKNGAPEKLNRVRFSGQIMDDLLTVLMRYNADFDKLCDIVGTLNDERDHIPGVVRVDHLKTFVEMCVMEKQPTKAIVAIEYCVDVGHVEAKDLASFLYKNMTLSNEHVDKLIALTGNLEENDSLGKKVDEK